MDERLELQRATRHSYLMDDRGAPVRVALGHQLRRLRKSQKLSLDDLAALSGYSVSTISKLEAGVVTTTRVLGVVVQCLRNDRRIPVEQ